jgi:ribosomal protein S18 acetylase RimI-like enzyme
MVRIRRAKRSDKKHILSFCSSTFNWGDYIDQVWDFWYSDKSGQLLVAEYCSEQIALSHVAVCPDKKTAWIEGIRVHPSYRRSQIASKLIGKMIDYSMKKGAHQASAIVAADNIASQRMMEKNGFEVISKWSYYSTNSNNMQKQKSDARFATPDELESIWQYLEQSRIYQLSAKRYFNSWHWYVLDRKTLKNFVNEGRVIMVGKPPVINGLAIINKDGYWDTTNVLQIIYLDSQSAGSIQHIMSFVTSLYIDSKFDRLQVLCHKSKSMTSFVDKFMIKEQEQFLLYSKIFTL